MNALLILFLTALVVLFVGVLSGRRYLGFITALGVVSAIASCVYDLKIGNFIGWSTSYNSMIQFDSFGLLFSIAILLPFLMIIGFSIWGFRNLNYTLGDHYGLLLFSACGALCMVSFNSLIMLFLGIEIMSIPLYVLAGSKRHDLASNEAALKYFLMGAFATGVLLFGMTLVFGATNSFNIAQIAATITKGTANLGLLKVGVLLMIIGLSFKISAVPFHFWAPDVYQGSPTLVTAFMSTVVKTAGIAAFYHLFSTAFLGLESFWNVPIWIIAALSMTLANFTAIFQTDFKRMMAYSSISHAGYLLLPILGMTNDGSVQALLLYVLAYGFATVCAFGVFILISEPKSSNNFDAFAGLSKKEPLLAAIMAISMLSLAGIPPLAGFFGKYFVFASVFAKYPLLVVMEKKKTIKKTSK